MNLFYHPLIDHNIVNLSEEDSIHLVRVMRKKNGDILHLTDGIGNLYKAEILDAHPKKCQVNILEKSEEYGKRDYYLHIAIAPTKNLDRFEWFLEKATEIGIDEITPIICARSERRNLNNLERLNKIVIAAMKQSVKAYLPKLNPLVSFQNMMKSEIQDYKKYIAHCNQSEKVAFETINKKNKNFVCIGPEGDFTEEEIRIAQENTFQAISLGKSRLRTETAAIVACSLFI